MSFEIKDLLTFTKVELAEQVLLERKIIRVLKLRNKILEEYLE
jgi:hypothetical protein